MQQGDGDGDGDGEERESLSEAARPRQQRAEAGRLHAGCLCLRMSRCKRLALVPCGPLE